MTAPLLPPVTGNFDQSYFQVILIFVYLFQHNCSNIFLTIYLFIYFVTSNIIFFDLFQRQYFISLKYFKNFQTYLKIL